MPVILITGAGSGLGLAFLEHYSQDVSNRIYAIDRSWPEPLSAPFDSDRVHQHTTNITSESDLEALTQILAPENNSGSDEGQPVIDLVLHSAGIRGLVPEVQIQQSSDVAKAETWDVMNAGTLMKTFEVNVAGTFLLIQHLLPFLRPSQSNSVPSPSKVVIMGSRMGSISSNVGGGAYAYRASKAALNAIAKSFSIDIPDVCFVVTHPGRVASKLCNGVREDNAMEAGEVLPGLVRLIDGWTLQDSGRYVDRFGEDIGW